MAPALMRVTSLACRVRDLGWGGVKETTALQAFQLMEENNARGVYIFTLALRKT